ncbi:MAG: hypothetical protein ACRDD7_15580 [Peptostreptococcaceae bacterium]
MSIIAWLSSKQEITKELYDKLKSFNRGDLSRYIENEIAVESEYHPAGYGFSSPELLEIDGKYYAKWMHWDSCD